MTNVIKKNYKRFLVFGLISILALSAYVWRDLIDFSQLPELIQQAGIWAPLIFILIYVLATLFFLPGSVITLSGGAIFGPVWGVVYNLLGATIGAILAFLIARYLASDWVAKRSQGVLKKLIEGVEQEGWRFVAFVRLVPLFPFNLLNYALGLSKIKLIDYSLASLICMLPGAIAYTYLGYIGKEAATGGEDMIHKILLGIALLAFVAFLPGLIKRFKASAQKKAKPALDIFPIDSWLSIQSLKKALDKNEDFILLDIRSYNDYAHGAGHIAQALSLPMSEVEENLPQQLASLSQQAISDICEQKIILICYTDWKSQQLAKTLKQNGFANVYVVKKGMHEWLRQGLPVVTSSDSSNAKVG